MAAMRRATSTAIIIDCDIVEIFPKAARDQELGPGRARQPLAGAGLLIGLRMNRATC
jgi:hypothetical protein